MEGSGRLRAYLALCDLMDNDTGEVWATRSSIATHMGLSDKAARKAIRLLIDDGLVSSKKARNRRGEWLVVHTFDGGAIEPEQNDRGRSVPEQSAPDGGTFDSSRRNKTTDQLDSALNSKDYTQESAREAGDQSSSSEIDDLLFSPPEQKPEPKPYKPPKRAPGWTPPGVTGDRRNWPR